MRTRDDIALPLHRKITTDATIVNSAHLNGSNKVSKSTSRNPVTPNPMLTIDLLPEGVLENAELLSVLVRFRLFIDNQPQSVDPDHERARLIELRLMQLFHEQPISGGVSGIQFRQSLKLGPARSLFDPSAPNETMFLNEYRVMVI